MRGFKCKQNNKDKEMHWERGGTSIDNQTFLKNLVTKKGGGKGRG